MSNIWNSEEEPSEYEMLEEASETEEIAETNVPHEVYDFSDIDESMIEEIQEESAFDLEEEDVASVYNVRVRLEQARLYEMLINHNLFDGVEASDQAIKNVQNELKEYIVSRLELLMGIRQPKTETREEIIIDQPFNDVEIDFLKQLSFKGTQGKSSSGEYTQPEARRVENTIKPLVVKKKQSLKPISSIKKQVVEKIVETVVEKPLRKTAKTPIKRVKKQVKAIPKTNNRVVTQVEMAKGKVSMTKKTAEQLAMKEIKKERAIKKSRGGKEWAEMNSKEKAAEIRRVNKRNAKPIPADAKPMMDQSAINAHYQTQQAIRGGKIGGTDSFNSMLSAHLINNK